MATAKKCDRCGVYYETHYCKLNENKVMNTMVVTYENNDKTIDICNTTQFDLCPDCCCQLVFWLGNKDARPIAIRNNVMGTTAETHKNK